MKKLLFLAMILLAGKLLLAQTPYVRVDDYQTKYEQLTHQTRVQCKITDYAISTLYAQLFDGLETSVRTVEVEGAVQYFYRIYRKEVKEQPAEEHKDKNARKDYYETFYRTDDGFQIGYSIKSRQTHWYLVLDRYSEDKVFFDSVTKLKDHFKKALAKFEEVKKKNGN